MDNSVNVTGAMAPDQQEERRPRKTYTEQEEEKYLQDRRTMGRKGIKLPRINMAFSPEAHDYIKTMARVRGESITDFVNVIIADHMDRNKELYEKAKEFINML